MENSEKEIISFYKRKIEPFIAIFLVALLCTTCVLLYQDNQLKKEIGQNCGYVDKWGGVCYCDKPTIDNMEAQMNGYSATRINLTNDNLDN